MVRKRMTDVPDYGGDVPHIARGRGRAPALVRGRGHSRVAPIVPPVDPVEDPIFEEQGEMPAAEPALGVPHVVVDRIYQSCIMTFYGFETRVDLLLLDITDFEIILGMEWFSLYHLVLDCHAKTVTLAMPELPRLEWKGLSISTYSRIIYFMKARHMVEKGYLVYLANVWDTVTETPVIDLVPVVREFFDVFPSDLPGMPPDRDIDFCIDFASGTQLISIPSYRMALKELKNLKNQLESC
ncbi:uncharacterized protein [Nicotiana tomentosiformis]|uniref:uncharacterized protein n=1 Tax=Nicotiana tomentosiformis TaxID=4098 RepID=UPI00388CAD5B